MAQRTSTADGEVYHPLVLNDHNAAVAAQDPPSPSLSHPSPDPASAGNRGAASSSTDRLNSPDLGGPFFSNPYEDQPIPPSPGYQPDTDVNAEAAAAAAVGASASASALRNSTGRRPLSSSVNNTHNSLAQGLYDQHLNSSRSKDVEYGNGRHNQYGTGFLSSKTFAGRRKWYWIGGGAILAAVIVGAVVGGVKGSSKSSGSSGHNGASGSIGAADSKGGSSNPYAGEAGGTAGASGALGTNGTVVTMENGQQFTYVNNFGGTFTTTPFDDSARPQSWTPALNETWDYTKMKIFGVNLGGWLVTEPFIVPGLFEPYENDDQPAVDEYTLMGKYGNNATAMMQAHYDSFITEEDFALIAAAGLNWVRIPIGHWAIETVDGEPFVEGLSWQYLVKALNWARKYGLRVNLDLHTAPGSQNGWNHSGRLGTIGWLRGVMGVTNAQRTLNHIRTLAEFISQPQYKNVVPMFSILNEPGSSSIGGQQLREFNLHAYQMVRGITGTGEGNGPWIMIHDGFEGFGTWRGFMSGADRLAMDQHNYLVFTQPNNDSPGYAATRPCTYWAQGFNNSMQNFGLTVSGEWCLAINDCGEYLNNVGNGARYEGKYIQPGRSTPQFQAVGSCSGWNDYRTWSDDVKAGFRNVAYAHMDALQNWFFWTWKIGVSTKTGIAPNPMWHLKLAIQEGYFPSDPRQHVGKCAQIVNANTGGSFNTASSFTAFPSPWMTGGAGAGNIAAAQLSSYDTWPPASLNAAGGPASNLPSYVPSGTPITLSAATPTPPPGSPSVDPGNGWANTADTAGWYVPKSGCNYLNPYSGVGAPAPTRAC